MRSRLVIAIIALGMLGAGSLVGCGSEEPRLQGASPQAEPADPHAGEQAAGDHAAGERAAGDHAAPAQAAGPQPTRVLDDGSRLYGAELEGERATTELGQILASPSTFDGQVVRTSGTIERVCQRMGCWMELRAADTAAVRVPMAGHAFFLPRDAAGRSATIEGRVAVEELSPEMREHLASEGAVATASALSIDATSVIVR